MIGSRLFLSALAACLLTPVLAQAQFRSFVRSPGVGPIVPWRPTPVFPRPQAYYSNYDPFGYNYTLNRMNWSPYTYPRLYNGGIYAWTYPSAYVPLTASPALTASVYQRDYLPDTGVGTSPLLPGTADMPKPRPATASLEVMVPSADTELYFNGIKTQQTGLKRSFTTPELEPGKAYSYEVRARWMENGKEMEQTRTVVVQAGNQSIVAIFPGGKEGLPPPSEKDQ